MAKMLIWTLLAVLLPLMGNVESDAQRQAHIPEGMCSGEEWYSRGHTVYGQYRYPENSRATFEDNEYYQPANGGDLLCHDGNALWYFDAQSDTLYYLSSADFTCNASRFMISYIHGASPNSMSGG